MQISAVDYSKAGKICNTDFQIILEKLDIFTANNVVRFRFRWISYRFDIC